MTIPLNPKLSNQLVRGLAINLSVEQAPILNYQIHVLDAAGFGEGWIE